MMVNNFQNKFDAITYECVKILTIAFEIFNCYLIASLSNGFFMRLICILFIIILHMSLFYFVINKLSNNKYAELMSNLYNKMLINSDITAISNDIQKINIKYGYVKLLICFCINVILKFINDYLFIVYEM